MNYCKTIWKAILFSAIYSTALAAKIESIPGEYIVKLKNLDGKIKLSKQELSQALGFQVSDIFFKDQFAKVVTSKVLLDSVVAKELSGSDLVDYVEPNYVYRIDKTPNDPLFTKSWGLKNTGQSDIRGPGIVGVDVNVEKAWDLTTGSKNTIVAVIDTGVDYTHPDLKDNMWVNEAEAKGKAGVDDDGNGYIDDVYGYNFSGSTPSADPKDDHGHGTHCAGVIGATGDDGRGLVGVNWNTRIMAVKFLSASGSGSTDGAIKAVEYAVKNGASVLSNSWGGGGFSQALRDVIESSNKSGSIFVAAAGNNSSSNDQTPTYPASYDVANIISIAAIDNSANLARFSNFGKNRVHVAAPGVNVYSTVLNGAYENMSGTSMATPHAAGVIALLRAYDDKLTNLEIKERIITTATKTTKLKNKVKSSGYVNAYNALTNTVAPPDLNDPETWNKKDFSFSTPHNYKKNSNLSVEINMDNTKEFSIYFSRFETESGYDILTAFDKSGKKLFELSGNQDDSFSPVIQGDYVKLVFMSDDSVEKYGFDITKLAFR
jgi:thermitase